MCNTLVVGSGKWRQQGFEAAIELLNLLQQTDSNLVKLPRPIIAIAASCGLRYNPTLGTPIAEVDGILYGNRILCSHHTSALRTRFTVAHELAHYLIGSTAPDLLAMYGLRDPAHQQSEAQADGYAAGLLIDHLSLRATLEPMVPHLTPMTPAEWVEMETAYKTVSCLVKTYKVSYAVTLQALADAGLVQGIRPWSDRTGVAFTHYRQCRQDLKTETDWSA